MSPVEPPQYPVNLIVTGRSCLVVGGGRIAARKASALATCGARVHVIAAEVGADVRGLEGVTFDERAYRDGDVAGYRLVITATDDPAVNARVFADGEAAGVWVNSADDPDNCSFTLPAVVRRGALTVTVSTQGQSPALASWLRTRLADEIGPEYEVLLDLLSTVRQRIRETGRSSESVDWQKALDSDMLALIKAGEVQQARERLQACLSSSSA